MNAPTPTSSAVSMIGAIVDSPSSRIVGPWCSDRHHVTDSWTIGMSANATMPITAAHRARFAGFSGSRRTARYAT